MNCKIAVDILVMEVTRECNMSCDMCLRGESENKDMPEDIIQATFEVIDEISSITPTGGEPLLVPKKTAEVIRMAREKGASSVFLSTNGSVSPFDDGVLDVIQEIAEFADDYYFFSSKTEVPEDMFYGCSIQVSRDDYHDDRITHYPKWAMFRNVSFGSGAQNSIISRGNARANGLGQHKDEETLSLNLSVESGSGRILVEVESILYVNVHGECFADCNLSYEQQDCSPEEGLPCGCYLGHISELRNTILKYAKEDNPELFLVPEAILV